jgi:hypothetical protein
VSISVFFTILHQTLAVCTLNSGRFSGLLRFQVKKVQAGSSALALFIERSGHWSLVAIVV